MNDLLYIFLSLSFSGSLLALILFFLKPLLIDRISKKWQYYIWIVVITRLLIPYTPQLDIVEKTLNYTGNNLIAEIQMQWESNNLKEKPKQQLLPQDKNTDHSLYLILNYLKEHAGLIWFFVTMLILVQKITSYNNYIAFIKTGNFSVNQELMNSYKVICEDLGIKKPLALYENNLAISPMLIGITNPFIILPTSKISKKELYNIVLHEFLHYKRLDIFYKWITQIAICFHWFNPLIYMINKEINKNCELSCDEAIIKKLNSDGKREYGNTLLASVRISKPAWNTVASITLSNDARLLKERLDAIMKFKKKSKFAFAFTIILTFVMCFNWTFIGAYALNSSDNTINDRGKVSDTFNVMKTASVGDITYYIVENEEDLRAIGSGIYSLSDNYMLNCDISLTKEWKSIGNDKAPFTGTFEGNGFTISNLTVKDKTAEYAGLFGFSEGAIIHNVTLTNVDIKDVVGHCKHIAPLVAVSLGSKISDCTVK